jgi:hypothetical protein
MVADPFAVEKDGTWNLFFEIDSISTRQGEIGLAVSTNLIDWTYRQIVLDEPFHLSYPQVFEWDGVFYMIPESHLANAVRLYRAERFPDQWAYVGDIVSGPHKDPSILRYKDRWWLFTCTGQNENMNIFYANKLSGPWAAHAENPVIQDNRSIARPGGRIQMIDGDPVRFAQDCLDRYGHKVLAFRIEELTPSVYRETSLPENPILEPDGHGWNARRMHHLDLHQIDSGKWIGFTDGNPN